PRHQERHLLGEAVRLNRPKNSRKGAKPAKEEKQNFFIRKNPPYLPLRTLRLCESLFMRGQSSPGSENKREGDEACDEGEQEGDAHRDEEREGECGVRDCDRAAERCDQLTGLVAERLDLQHRARRFP